MISHQELRAQILSDLLVSLRLHTEPYEEIKGQTQVTYDTLAPQVWEASMTKAAYLRFAQRAIDSFELLSVEGKGLKPQVGVVWKESPSVTQELEIVAFLQALGCEPMLVNRVDLALFEAAAKPHKNLLLAATVAKLRKPLVKMLKETENFLPNPSPVAVIEQAKEKTDTLVSEKFAAFQRIFLAKLDAAYFIQPQDDIGAQIDGIWRSFANEENAEQHSQRPAKKFATSLCHAHFSASQPIQLSQKQMEAIERAKKDAKKRIIG